MIELLGEKLANCDGSECATGDALEGKAAVGLYFSAHWCPPCRGFTPQLAGWYKEGLSDKGLEIVFVSSDRDEDAFKGYAAEQPWKSLPFADRDRKAALSKKFEVEGIPTLILLDADGNLINKDGRSAISEDPKGEDFPWKQKTFKEILASCKFVGKDGPVDGGVLNDRVFGLYFSAHWCPPCRGFTPQLAEWYQKSLKDKGLEIVFVSSDRDEDAFKEYFADQPWLALDYSCRKEKGALNQYFGVQGIPSFVIVDKDGSTITKDGRSAVSADPEGNEFPWYPKPVPDLPMAGNAINKTAFVLMLCEAVSEEGKTAAVAAAEPLAKKFLAEAKAKGEDKPEVAFGIAKVSDGMTSRIRDMTGLPKLSPDTNEELPPKLILINIPDNGGYYIGAEGDLTAATIEAFVSDFQAGKLERKQLG